MNRFPIRIAFALVALTLVTPPAAATSDSRLAQALQAPPPAAQPFLIAQQRDREGNYTCVLDGRQVPQGLTHCIEGYVTFCNGRGTWERTTQRC